MGEGGPRQRKQLQRLALCLLLGIALLWTLGGRQQLEVMPLDCGQLYRDELCELLSSQQLKVRIAASHDARLVILDGWHLGAARQEGANSSAGLRFLSLPLRTDTTGITVVAWSWAGVAVRKLRLRPSTDPDWLREARALWLAGRGREALPNLRRHLAEPVKSEKLGPGLGLQALILIDDGKVDEAKLLFEQALIADRQAGLVSDELYHVLSLSDILGRRQAQIAEAEKLFQTRQELLVRMPALRVWESYHQAMLRFQSGDLAGALAATMQGLRLAPLFDDGPGQNELQLEQAVLLGHLGRFFEARALLPSILKKELDDCTRVRVLHVQGWLSILARQARTGQAAAAHDDPQPPLGQALALLENNKCPQVRTRAMVLTDLAHARSLAGDADQAERWLREATKILKSDRELQWEWRDLEGEIQLMRGNWPAAKAAYTQLVALSERANAYESQLRALLGLAVAHESEDREASLRYFAEARKLLEDRALVMPLGAGHSSYVGSYQRGTELELDLLLRINHRTEALALIRNSRLRGLRALARFEQIGRFDPAQRDGYNRVVDEYRRARVALQETVIQARDAATDELEPLKQEMQAREQQLLSFLAKTPGAPQQKGAEPQRPIAPRELLLTCHPTARAWACLLADDTSVIDVIETAGLPDEKALARLISPLKTKRDAFDRLVILPFGAMRNIDVHRMPFWEDAAPLWSRIEVVYGLDLPPQETPDAREATPPKEAFVFVDSEGNLKYSRSAGAPMAKALTELHWQVRLQVGGAKQLGGLFGAAPRSISPASLDKSVKEWIAASDLFVYAGHADYAPSGGWIHALRIPDDAGILVGDILTLQRVPRHVLLLACESGRSDEETGGQEGLGLGQAFLMAGSRSLLATVRPVRDDVTAAVAAALVRRLSTAQPGVTSALLRTVLQEVRQMAWPREVAQSLDTELGAFRVFVP